MYEKQYNSQESKSLIRLLVNILTHVTKIQSLKTSKPKWSLKSHFCLNLLAVNPGATFQRLQRNLEQVVNDIFLRFKGCFMNLSNISRDSCWNTQELLQGCYQRCFNVFLEKFLQNSVQKLLQHANASTSKNFHRYHSEKKIFRYYSTDSFTVFSCCYFQEISQRSYRSSSTKVHSR